MYRVAIGFLVVSFFALAATPPASAQGQVFTVRNVPVDASAGDAHEAQAIAVRSAHLQAWRRLMERLVTTDPSLVAEPDSETLLSFVQSIEVADEKITTGRYRADITVRFRADSVLGWLDQSGVAHTKVPSPILVVLPVLTTPDAVMLWQEGNGWLAAWQRRQSIVGGVELVAPVGDLDDLLAVDANGALDGDWQGMAALLGRYGADGVLVTHIRESAGVEDATAIWYEGPDGETVPLGFHGGSESVVEEVVDDVEISQDGGVLEMAVIEDDVAAEPSHATDFSAMVDFVSAGVNDYWHAVALTPEGAEAVMVAEIPVRNLAEWVTIRERLARPAALNETLPLVVSTDRVRVLLRYVGTLSELRTSLRQVGLNLTAQGDTWLILPL